MDSEVLDSYEIYKAREEALSKDRAKIAIAYADYRSALFGVMVMVAPEGGFPEDTAGKTAAVDALKQTAALLLFKKFGSALKASDETRSSLSELLAEAGSRPDCVTVMSGDRPTIYDYSGSESGICVAISVPVEAVRAASSKERLSMAMCFTGHDWHAVLGYTIMPDSPGSQFSSRRP